MTKLLLIFLNSLLILKRVKEIVRILCQIVSTLSVYVCGLKHSTAFMHRSYKTTNLFCKMVNGSYCSFSTATQRV